MSPRDCQEAVNRGFGSLFSAKLPARASPSIPGIRSLHKGEATCGRTEQSLEQSRSKAASPVSKIPEDWAKFLNLIPKGRMHNADGRQG